MEAGKSRGTVMWSRARRPMTNRAAASGPLLFNVSSAQIQVHFLWEFWEGSIEDGNEIKEEMHFVPSIVLHCYVWVQKK